MAAYAALVTLSKAVDQILPYEQHYSFLCDKHEMQSLLDKVTSFQLFLEDVSGKSSDGIDELESRIKDVAHRLEDIVESILVQSLDISRKSFFSGLLNKLCFPCFGCSIVEDGTDILGWCLDQDLESKAKYSHLPLTERAASAFGNFVGEVELLLEESMEMKKILDNRVVIATTSSSRDPPSATDTKVGLDGDLNRIVDQITGRTATFQVVPVTGMGGIGKTTLARAVFEHPKTVSRFDVRLWATVSQQYNVKEILQGLLLSGKDKKDESVGELIVQVHKQLVGRRYLIILDDVWDEEVWDGVQNAFPDDKKGSRIVLTTRLSNIATYVIGSSSTHAHQMQLLNEEQSWDLLRETVYGHGAAGFPGAFEDMGRMVSRSCKGLPLALVVIGGLLKFNNTRDHWLKVAKSTTTKADGNDESLFKIMSLSYTNLPPHLKACFLYFGVFPEDKEIPTKELVRLWCAEGFLKPRESKTMEVVAEECLEELVERNLILVMKKRYNGKIKTSTIHDVLRDLSSSQAQNEKFFYRYDGSYPISNDTFLRIMKDQRRVSLPECYVDFRSSSSSPVRTSFFETHRYWNYDQRSVILRHLKLVRVLGIVEFSSPAFRISVRLNNLRYLHLHKGYNDEPLMVPKSISKLRNLETLFVSCGYASLHKYDLFLPLEIWEMPRLRHLVSKVTMQLLLFPASSLDDSSIESLSLQTLTGLVNFDDFTPSVIQKFQNLKKLQINCKEISIGDENKVFCLDNLVNLHRLEDLTISHSRNGPRVRNIGFPSNLKKLRLRDTVLPWEKMTSIGDLIHLEVLKLGFQSFVGEVWEPIEGGFPQLKYLKMDNLWSLEEWRAESTHFPSLEQLVILECRNLKEVPCEIGDVDTLEKLIVKKYWKDDVGDGFEESVRMIQEESVRAGNDSLQVIILSKDQELRHVDR